MTSHKFERFLTKFSSETPKLGVTKWQVSLLNILSYIFSCTKLNVFLFYFLIPYLEWVSCIFRNLSINVTGGRFDRMGPLACLIPFPVLYWIRSDMCSDQRFFNLQFLFMFKIKVPNKSLSKELNNVLFCSSCCCADEQCSSRHQHYIAIHTTYCRPCSYVFGE